MARFERALSSFSRKRLLVIWATSTCWCAKSDLNGQNHLILNQAALPICVFARKGMSDMPTDHLVERRDRVTNSVERGLASPVMIVSAPRYFQSDGQGGRIRTDDFRIPSATDYHFPTPCIPAFANVMLACRSSWLWKAVRHGVHLHDVERRVNGVFDVFFVWQFTLLCPPSARTSFTRLLLLLAHLDFPVYLGEEACNFAHLLVSHSAPCIEFGPVHGAHVLRRCSAWVVRVVVCPVRASHGDAHAVRVFEPAAGDPLSCISFMVVRHFVLDLCCAHRLWDRVRWPAQRFR
jgi:hypothetical protein